MRIQLLILLNLLIWTNFATAQGNEKPVVTVPHVDLNLYLGKWYELASIPQSFSKDCVRDTTAEYQLADEGLIKVLNSCTTKENERQVAEGRAKSVDAATNSKLKVTFVKILGNWIFQFGGDYWVIDLADDYSFAVVGHPTRKYGWILSRTPAISPELLKEISSRLVLQGYDLCKFNITPQAGGLATAKPLCEGLQ